jgi:hypothetical protein
MTCSRASVASFDVLCRPLSCPTHKHTHAHAHPCLSIRRQGCVFVNNNGLRFIVPRSYGMRGRDRLLVLSLVTSTPSDKVFTDNPSLSRSLSLSLFLWGSSDEFRSRLHFDFIFNKLFNRWTLKSKKCVCLLLQDLVQSCSHGGGGYGRACATRDDEPRPVWTRLPITH